MTILKKIPNDVKKLLSPEATYGEFVVLADGRIYLCVESANDFLFAGWQKLNPWRRPIMYARILLLKRKLFREEARKRGAPKA